MDNVFAIVIIGGGAAGFFSAIRHAYAHPDATIYNDSCEYDA